MKTHTFLQLFLIITAVLILQCRKKADDVIRDDFKKYYDAFDVSGSFALYDAANDHYVFYNKAQFKTSFTPASTFKICNSLIGLETGVIKDEHFVIEWDSIERNPVWDKNHDLKTAFANSTVWYYQELARRVGGVQMKHWLDTVHYGNADSSGGIDKFWLDGGLRISPEGQINFLKRLHDNALPFSQRSMDIVKNIMIAKDTLGCVIRGKSGWGGDAENETGWFVGYVETKGRVYYFSNCIQTDSKHMSDNTRALKFDNARREIVYRILADLNIVKVLPD